MNINIKNFLKPIVVIALITGLTASCTANGKLRKPPAPPTPAGAPKPPAR